MKKNNLEKIFCPKCRRWLPATNDYFWNNKQYKSDLHECGCRQCELFNQHLKRDDNAYYPERQYDFDDFAKEAEEDARKRMLQPEISIHEPIAPSVRGRCKAM